MRRLRRLHRYLAAPLAVMAIAAVLFAPTASGAGTCSVAANQLPAGTTGTDGSRLAGESDDWFQVQGECTDRFTKVRFEVPAGLSIVGWWAHTGGTCRRGPENVLECDGKDLRICAFIRTQPAPVQGMDTHTTVTFPDGTTFDTATPVGPEAPACAIRSRGDSAPPPTTGADLSVEFVDPPPVAELTPEEDGDEDEDTYKGRVEWDIRIRNNGPERSSGSKLVLRHSRKVAGATASRLIRVGDCDLHFQEQDCLVRPLRPGQKAFVRISVRIRTGTKTTDAVTSTAEVHPADSDLRPSNNRTAAATKLTAASAEIAAVGPAGFRGSAAGGATAVDVAVARLGGGASGFSGQAAAVRCRWLTSGRGAFARERRVRNGRCDEPRWLRARGTRRWSFDLARALPSGRYVVYARGVGRGGAHQVTFSRQKKNRRELRVR